jgi:hypothetical protein
MQTDSVTLCVRMKATADHHVRSRPPLLLDECSDRIRSMLAIGIALDDRIEAVPDRVPKSTPHRSANSEIIMVMVSNSTLATDNRNPVGDIPSASEIGATTKVSRELRIPAIPMTTQRIVYRSDILCRRAADTAATSTAIPPAAMTSDWRNPNDTTAA